MNTLKNYIQANLVITNKEAEELGYSRHNLSELTKKWTIRKIKTRTISIKRKSNRRFCFNIIK